MQDKINKLEDETKEQKQKEKTATHVEREVENYQKMMERESENYTRLEAITCKLLEERQISIGERGC